MIDAERTGLESDGHVFVLPDTGRRVCTFGCRNGSACGFGPPEGGRTILHCRMDTLVDGKPVPPVACGRCFAAGKSTPATVLIRPIGADTPAYVDAATAPLTDRYLCANCANREMDT